MPNPTFLDLKTFVTNQLGGVDQATYTAKRDNIINIARKKFYSEHAWSFLRVPNTTVTLTAQVGSLPTDYNLKFSPIDVYTYSGTLKYQYGEVAFSDLDMHGTDTYVYAINRSTKQIKTNQTSVGSIIMEYTKLPADRPANTTEDSLEEAAPTITAIGYLAISMWWLSKERSTSKFQLFDDKYKEEVAILLREDQMSDPVSFFSASNPYLNNGYTSRY